MEKQGRWSVIFSDFVNRQAFLPPLGAPTLHSIKLLVGSLRLGAAVFPADTEPMKGKVVKCSANERRGKVILVSVQPMREQEAHLTPCQSPQSHKRAALKTGICFTLFYRENGQWSK